MTSQNIATINKPTRWVNGWTWSHSAETFDGKTPKPQFATRAEAIADVSAKFPGAIVVNRSVFNETMNTVRFDSYS